MLKTRVGILMGVAALWMCFGGTPPASRARTILYVAADGNAAGTGKIDGPFATLVRARDEIRRLRASKRLAGGGVTVVVRGGTYYLPAPFELTSEDSGTAAALTVYTAYPGEEVRLSGGRPIKGLQRVSDPAVLARLSEDARAAVRQVDLKALGVTDYGSPAGGGLEVFSYDQPLQLARWPNQGFVKIGDLVVDDGYNIRGTRGSKVGQFHYDGDHPQRWVGETDPWLHGYWFWDWSEQRQRLASIDAEKKVLTVAPPAHIYGYRKGQWYYAFNMLSELDTPGEYYVDRQKGILYFWPPSWFEKNRTVVSVLDQLVVMKNVSHVAWHGFTFEAARGTAIRVEGGSHDLIESCVMRNLGGLGAELEGREHGIAGCEIYQVGKGGISLKGGDRKTLTPGDLFAVDNHIHDYGRIFRMYHAGIAIDGVGIRLSNNLIHSAPHMGIYFAGNDHTIEYNEIHHVCEESNDAGAIYAGRNWTMRGNVIRHNYLHDISGFQARGAVGVYLDDMFASARIYGNLFRNVTAAAFLGGGRDCAIENNLFIDCTPSVHVDARALGWAHDHADGWIEEAKARGTISGIAYRQAPYASKYPQLPSILDDDPKAPKGNLIARNVCVGGRWDRIESRARPYLKVQDNLLTDDPHFVDAVHQDFRFKPDSPAFRLGFQRIPLERIGLYNGGGKGNARLRVALDEIPGAAPALARQARIEKDYDRADSLFAKCARTNADLRIEWGNTLMEANRGAAARKVFDAVADNPGAPAARRSIARLQSARSFAFEKDYDHAMAAYRRVKEIGGIPPHHIWEAEECVRELQRLKAGLPARDPRTTRTAFEPLPRPGKVVFVSPHGADTNPGTCEQPLATLARAVEEVRHLKRDRLPKGGIRVQFQGGVYLISSGVKMDASISGTKESPVVFAAAEDESVIFNGGVRIDGFAPVTDPAVLARLPQEGRGHVLQLDLRSRGITQYGALISRGFGVANANNASLELFFNGRPMTPARWPNEGFVRTGRVLERGLAGEGKTGRFVFNSPRMERWTSARDMMMYGYEYYDWADCTVGVASIDAKAREIRTAHGTIYGYKEGQPFLVFNLLEELDAPGEWYLDRAAGLLYFYPPSDPSRAVVELSMVEEPLLTMADVSNVTLQGLGFELGRGDGLVLEGGENCRILACTFRRLGGTGLSISKGKHHAVMASDLYTLGCGGMRVIGGNRATLTPSGHLVENCDVYDFGRIDRTYTPAVYVEGVGMRIAHNRFHDAPSSALRIEGNNHLVEYNDVYNVIRESDDQGGIDVFLNPTYRGNVFRYNFWHDIGNGKDVAGQAGIRLDDAISGTLIYGNVFYRSSDGHFGGVQIHGGKDNWVDNNLFVDCRFGVSLSQWSEKRWPEFLDSDPIRKLLAAVKVSQPPYSTAYPDLARLRDRPFVNRIWRNLAVDSVEFLARERISQDKLDNVVTRVDPGFLDLAAGDLRWKAGAPALRNSSFRPIPFDEIGLYRDALRPALRNAGNPATLTK
jgi:hypothetical protein